MAWLEPTHVRETAPMALGAGRQYAHSESLPAQTEVPRATSTCADARFSSPVT